MYSIMLLFALLVAGAFTYVNWVAGAMAAVAVVGGYGEVSVVHGMRFANAIFVSQAADVLEMLRIGEAAQPQQSHGVPDKEPAGKGGGDEAAYALLKA